MAIISYPFPQLKEYISQSDTLFMQDAVCTSKWSYICIIPEHSGSFSKFVSLYEATVKSLI